VLFSALPAGVHGPDQLGDFGALYTPHLGADPEQYEDTIAPSRCSLRSPPRNTYLVLTRTGCLTYTVHNAALTALRPICTDCALTGINATLSCATADALTFENHLIGLSCFATAPTDPRHRAFARQAYRVPIAPAVPDRRKLAI
jgi:hypothetical protein